jgi:hypothetical protein
MQIVPLLSSVTDLAFEHGRLDLIGENRKMAGQLLEQVPLGLVSSKIADELALGRVGPQLFQLRLIVPHSTPRRVPLPRLNFTTALGALSALTLAAATRGT